MSARNYDSISSSKKIEYLTPAQSDHINKVNHEMELWRETIGNLEAELKKLQSLQPKELPLDVHTLDEEQRNFVPSAPDFAAYLREEEIFVKFRKEQRKRAAELLQQLEMECVLSTIPLVTNRRF